MKTFEELQAKVREEWRPATPFRVGILAGELGLSSSNHPYAPGSRGEKCFKDGVRVGLERQRASKAKQHNPPALPGGER